MRRLEGKVAIVTGATMGIGEATARRLHEEGARLVLVARGRERCEALARELGKGTTFVAGSVTDRDVGDAAVSAAADLGGVDVLVNNAGVDLTGGLLDIDEAEVRQTVETNFFGALWMLVRVGRELRDRGGGSIVNVTSRLASIGVPTMSIYAASKGALLALTRSAAVELAEFNIRVNAVAPGLTETPLLREWIASQPDPEAFEQRIRHTIPQRRLASASDVAAAIAYLSADESAHVTGISIPVDGGYTAA
ncbi:MAG TPA: glucose 1-dehydrogenase [Solirubrobacteraceae bacterium]|nr:glucose 1-dehydrogenase [Solirubrobacteraceae bacterium]